MGRIVLLVGIVAAISLLAVYAVSTRTPTEDYRQIRVPPILENSKMWAPHDDEVVR